VSLRLDLLMLWWYVVSSYKFILIDEFGGACRKFVSKLEATPYLTDGMRLQALPKQPKDNPYIMAALQLPEAPF
jgi:hypothetical protein